MHNVSRNFKKRYRQPWGRGNYGRDKRNFEKEEQSSYFRNDGANEAEPFLKNPLNVFATYFKFTTRCTIEEDQACSKCLQKKKTRCSCVALAQHLGKHPSYTIDEVQTAKDALNNMRNCLDGLNIEEWKSHTSRTLLTSKVVPSIRRMSGGPSEGSPEMVTNAWCKMYEILRGCQLIHKNVIMKRSPPELRTAHLCECPGAFICAVNHYLHTDPETQPLPEDKSTFIPPKLSWKAVSLNPYFEGNDLNAMIDDDAFYRETHYNWLRGEDDSGNIKSVSNIAHFTRAFVVSPTTPQEDSGKNTLTPNDFRMVDLVTADGSVDSQYDANAQESITAALHLAEFVTAVKLLGHKGHLVLKMFTLFEHHSLALLALCSCLFETILIVKPVMSRAGSGEVYLVAKNFRGLSSSLNAELMRYLCSDSFSHTTLFPREWIPDHFFKEFCSASKHFAERQTLAIKTNLSSYNSRDIKVLEASINAERTACVSRFFRLMFIRPIPLHLKLVTRLHLSGGQTNSNQKQVRKRVGGVQSDRFEFKMSFDAFQSFRLTQYKKNPKYHEVFYLTFDVEGSSVQSKSTPEESVVPNKFMRMMLRMNYEEGQGLGKTAQGITKPILPTETPGTRALRSSMDVHTVTSAFSESNLRRDSVVYGVMTQIDGSAKYYHLKMEEKRYTSLPHIYPDCSTVNDREWVTWGSPLLSCNVKISRFIHESLLTKLLRARVESGEKTGRLPVMSAGDGFLVLGGSHSLNVSWDDDQEEHKSTTQAENDTGLPSSSAVDLIFLLRDAFTFSNASIEAGKTAMEENDTLCFLEALLKAEFGGKEVLELTSNGLSLPVATLFEPLGIKTRLVISEDILTDIARQKQNEPISSTIPVLQRGLKDYLRTDEPFNFCRPFYWKTILTHRHTANVMLDLTFRQHKAKRPNALVYADPFRRQPQEPFSVEQEYAHVELNSTMQLLAFAILGLAVLEKHGTLILRLHTVLTRFTVTLLLVLSFHFESTVVYRPPSVPSWTTVRYVCFRNALYPSLYDGKAKKRSGVLSYLMWIWNATILKYPTHVPMQLLPPLCYTDDTVIQWITTWNNILAEDELEDILCHTNREGRIVATKEECHALCMEFLSTHHMLGFFFKQLMSPNDRLVTPLYKNPGTTTGSKKHDPSRLMTPQSGEGNVNPGHIFRGSAASEEPQRINDKVTDTSFGTLINNDMESTTSLGLRESLTHVSPPPQLLQSQWTPSTLSHMDVELSCVAMTM